MIRRDYYEVHIARDLAAAGGPPELAATLRAIARVYGVPERVTLLWIENHQGDWTPLPFRSKAARYQAIRRGRKIKAQGGAA